MRRVLLVSGLAGWCLGVAHVDWQWALEHAQVMAGVVYYPPEHPLAAHHASAWSLVSQLCAVGLRLGLTEATLSWLLSGLMGVVSCQAIALMVFALSGRVLASVGAVFVVILSRATDWGVTYQIWLYGSAHTYGVFGLSTAALAIALAGAGARRAAAFLAPVAVAIHAPIGAFAVVTLAAAWLWARIGGDPAGRVDSRLGVPLALGVALAAASFIAHRLLAPAAAAASVDPQIFVVALLELWDGHRQPIAWTEGAVRIVAGLAIAGVVWLRIARPVTPPHARLLLRAAVIAAGFGLVAVAATRIPIGNQPDWLIGLMPGRLLNVALFLAVPVLLGLSLSLPGRWGSGVTLFLTAGLVTSRRSRLWPLLLNQPPDASELGVDQLTVLVVALVAMVAVAWRINPFIQSASIVRDRVTSGLRGLTVLLTLGALLLIAFDGRRQWLSRRDLRDWRNDQVFAVAAGAGMTLTSGDPWLVQLRTRAPMLIDPGAIDTLAYAASAAPATERVLKAVYGTSLLAPPAGMRREGRVPPDHTRAIWESYSDEDWIRIGREFSVTRVVTQEGWLLKLPSLMRGGGVQVFEIPKD